MLIMEMLFMETKYLNNLIFYIIRTLMFIYFYIYIFLFYYINYLILINEQISPSKDRLRAQAVYDLAEIIVFLDPNVSIKFET